MVLLKVLLNSSGLFVRVKPLYKELTSPLGRMYKSEDRNY